MRSISVILAVSVSLALQGCAATEGIEPTDLSTVKAGASRADVEAVLGSPVETVKSDADEQYTVITYAYNRGAAGDPNLMPTCPKDAHYTCGAMLLLVLPFVVPMAVGESQEVYAEQRGHLYVTYDQAQRVRLVETKEHRNLVMAAEQGDIEAAYKLSQYALFMNAASRWRWLCLAAHGGHAQAQLLVADYYRYGYGGFSVDQAQTYKWFSLAEESGIGTQYKARFASFLSPDQIAQGEHLLDIWEPNPSECEFEAMTDQIGQGVPKSAVALFPEQPFVAGRRPKFHIVDGSTGEEVIDAVWLEKRAKELDAAATYFLAYSVPNWEVSFRLFCLSAHEGFGEAQHEVGRYYGWGIEPVQRDQVEGYKWLSLAEASGEKSAMQIDALAKSMTPDQIAEAERLVAEWEPDPAECELEPMQSAN
jgi:TPR repeat protein